MLNCFLHTKSYILGNNTVHQLQDDNRKYEDSSDDGNSMVCAESPFQEVESYELGKTIIVIILLLI